MQCVELPEYTDAFTCFDFYYTSVGDQTISVNKLQMWFYDSMKTQAE